jgi:hypothetical protein
MKSRFHEAADAELTEAVVYYDEKASGLGGRVQSGDDDHSDMRGLVTA